MIDYPNCIFSEEKVMEMWNKAYAKDPKNYKPEFVMRAERSSLSKNSRFPGIYYCAFDDEVIVAYSGWRDDGPYFVMSGARTAEHRQADGISNVLRAKKMEVVNSKRKPTIVILNNKKFQESWQASWMKIDFFRLSETSTKDKLREWTGDDEAYLRYRDTEENTFVYFPSGMGKAWAILTDYSNHILQWEGY